MNNISNAAFFHWPETKTLLAAFQSTGHELRFVGGCVRDALLGKEVMDVDLCTPLLPHHMEELLRDHHIRTIPTGIKHGTITAIIGKRSFEITTLRRDVACDGRHAEVEFSESFAEDAARRDFTINAMSADIKGDIHDYYHGIEDLRARCLRFIGDAEHRILEDALRILRLFRFQAQLGYEVDRDALHAAGKLKHQLNTISKERISMEMLKMLSCRNPQAALQSMADCSVLKELFAGNLQSDISPLVNAEEALTHQPEPMVRLAYLAAGNSTSDYFKSLLVLSNQQTQHLETLLLQKTHIPPALDASARKKLQRKLGTATFLNALLLNAANHPSMHDTYKKIQMDAKAWHIPIFPVMGADLIAQGMESGKHLGETLAKLEQAWEASDYQLSKEALLNMVIS